MKKYKLEIVPPIGSNDYLSVIEKNDEIIEESSEEIFKMLPSTIKVNNDLNAYLRVKKISNTCWICCYETWKDVYSKDFEMINAIFTKTPSLKTCLYEMYFEVEKWTKKRE